MADRRIDDVIKEVFKIFRNGGWRGTKTIHDHLKSNGHKISRRKLLGILHTYAEPGEYVSIGGINQKSWLIDIATSPG